MASDATIVRVEDGSAVIWNMALLRRLREHRILAQTTTARQMQRKFERQLQVPSTIGREALLFSHRMGWLNPTEAEDGTETEAEIPPRKRTRSQMESSSTEPAAPAASESPERQTFKATMPRDVMQEGDSTAYIIFVDLWIRGYYVGDGCRYGADYVAYVDDPEKCHSFAAVVVRDVNWRLTMPQLAGLTRMQNVVRKAAVFAFLDEGEGDEPGALEEHDGDEDDPDADDLEVDNVDDGDGGDDGDDGDDGDHDHDEHHQMQTTVDAYRSRIRYTSCTFLGVV